MIFDYLIFCAFSIPIALYDIKYMKIPNYLSISGFFVYVAYLILSRQNLLNPVITVILVALILFIVRRITHNGLGLGDIKYALLIALFSEIPYILFSLFFASLLGILYFLLLYIQRKQVHNRRIPFAPFLFIGSLFGKASALFIPNIF